MIQDFKVNYHNLDPSRLSFLDDFSQVFSPYYQSLIHDEIPIPETSSDSSETESVINLTDQYQTDSSYLIKNTMSFSLDLKDLPFKKLLFYMIPVPFGGGSGSEALILREHTYTILFARPIESTVVFTDKKKYTGRVGFFNTAVKLKEINGFKPIPSTPDLWNSKDGLQLTHNLHRYRLLPQVLQFLVHARQKAEGQELPRSALTRFLDQKVISESKSLFKKSPIEKLTPLNKFKLPMGFPIRFNDDQGISVLLTKFDNKKTLVQVGDFSQDPQLALDVLIQICSTLLEYSSN